MENQTYEQLKKTQNFANIILTNYNKGSPSIPQEVADKYYKEALEVQDVLYTRHGDVTVVRTPVRLNNINNTTNTKK